MSEYTVTLNSGITEIRFSTSPSLTVCIQAVNEVAEKYPTEKRLWFLDKGWNLTSAEIRKIANHGKKMFLRKGKSALVASEDLAYGLSRVFEAMREDGLTSVEVFRSEEDAKIWLLNDKTL